MTCVIVGDVYDCGKVCLILILFRLPQISCFTLNLKCLSSDPDSCSHVGIGHFFILLHTKVRYRPTNISIFFLSSFILHSFVVVYILFRWAGTPLSFQLVFCKHICVWRCIPDVSIERNVLNVQLLFYHLVHFNFSNIKNKTAMNIHVHALGYTYFLFFSFLF